MKPIIRSNIPQHIHDMRIWWQTYLLRIMSIMLTCCPDAIVGRFTCNNGHYMRNMAIWGGGGPHCDRGCHKKFL